MTNLEKVLDVFVKIKTTDCECRKVRLPRSKVVSYGTIAYNNPHVFKIDFTIFKVIILSTDFVWISCLTTVKILLGQF